MRKFKVDITLAIGMLEEPYYHTTEIEAETEGEVLHIITSKTWFGYVTKYKADGREYERYSWIQVKHIADIYIRDAEEGKP